MFQGDTIASCDSYGIVKIWDTRVLSPKASINVGPHPANKIAFDPTGKFALPYTSSPVASSWRLETWYGSL